MPIGVSLNLWETPNSSGERIPPTVVIPFTFPNGISFENYINDSYRGAPKKLVGRGRHATVYEIEIEGQIYLIREQKFNIDDFREECLIINKFRDSEYVMKLFGAFFKDGTGYMLLEYVPGRTMLKWLEEEGTRDEAERFRVYIQLLKGLKEIHSRGNVHLDIKPANIWIPTDKSKPAFLLDFGLARLDTNRRSVSEVGTKEYLSEAIPVSLKQRNYFALGRVIGQYNDISYPTRKTGANGFGSVHHKLPNTTTPIGIVVDLLQKSATQSPDDFEALIEHLTRNSTSASGATGGGSAAAAATRRRRASKKMTRRARRRRA